MSLRYLHAPILNHLNSLRQMVFLTGPRQVGKTTLAKSFLKEFLPGVNYFNWDLAEHRRYLLTRILSGKERLEGKGLEVVVFDEIHKYPRWKNALKGLFDLHEPEHSHWIVTGSAMLNVYRKGQDSLLGRHFTYHLAPFSVAELAQQGKGKALTLDRLATLGVEEPSREEKEAFQSLGRLSGFPEPLFKGEEAFLRRWRTTRLDRLINQDLAATENLRHLPLVERLAYLLPERVGSPLSLNSLREDLEVHLATVKHWMDLLERVFYGFFVRPYFKRSTRMLRKEAKWYLWDWTEIEDEAARFENLVAVHLTKYVNFQNELGLDNLSLHYIRDKEKREADFLVTRKGRPFLLVECKQSDTGPAAPLFHFADLLGVKHAFQLVAADVLPRIHREKDFRLWIGPAARFLGAMV